MYIIYILRTKNRLSRSLLRSLRKFTILYKTIATPLKKHIAKLRKNYIKKKCLIGVKNLSFFN